VFRSVALDVARYLGLLYDEAEIPEPPVRPESPRLFPAALTKAKVVVTHGGSGSLYQSVMAGIPVVVVPQHLEHRDNGDAVVDAHVGTVARSLTKESLARAIEAALDRSIVQAAAQLSRRLRSMSPDLERELRQ
jgi:UDP:flavonoid glycosyltransferase YjiC (YdhE family)